MGVDAVLVGTIVIRRHMKGGVGARFPGRSGQRDGVGGVVGAAASDHFHPARRPFDGELDDPAVLGRREGGRFAGGPARDQGMASFAHLPANEIEKSVLIQRFVPENRHQSRDRPAEHSWTPSREGRERQ